MIWSRKNLEVGICEVSNLAHKDQLHEEDHQLHDDHEEQYEEHQDEAQEEEVEEDEDDEDEDHKEVGWEDHKQMMGNYSYEELPSSQLLLPRILLQVEQDEPRPIKYQQI